MSEKPCPNCGHCPSCGRSNAQPYPYLQPPYYPGRPFIYGGTYGGTNAQNVTVSGANAFLVQ